LIKHQAEQVTGTNAESPIADSDSRTVSRCPKFRRGTARFQPAAPFKAFRIVLGRLPFDPELTVGAASRRREDFSHPREAASGRP